MYKTVKSKQSDSKHSIRIAQCAQALTPAHFAVLAMLGMFGLVCEHEDSCSCGDLDGCCDPNASCVRRACACNAGYSGDGLSCAAVSNDACADSPCFDGVACTSLETGAFSCADCPAGYAGDGTFCEEVDDCAGTPCGAGGTCTDTGNSYTCACNEAYYFADGTCMVEDECSVDDANDCDFNAVCVFLGPGQHSCNCMFDSGLVPS
jgi:hypothetical protein